jgi:hypothetical protein
MTTSTEKIFFIRLVRVIEGQHVPWVLCFDSQRRIVDEGPIDEVRKRRDLVRGVPLKGQQIGRVDDIRKAREEALRQRGIQAVRKGRTLEITGMPPAEVLKETAIATFFSREDPCPDLFPGVENLRERYFTELDEMKKTGCRSCQLSKVSKKYRMMIDSSLQIHEQQKSKAVATDHSGT